MCKKEAVISGDSLQFYTPVTASGECRRTSRVDMLRKLPRRICPAPTETLSSKNRGPDLIIRGLGDVTLVLPCNHADGPTANRCKRQAKLAPSCHMVFLFIHPNATTTNARLLGQTILAMRSA